MRNTQPVRVPRFHPCKGRAPRLHQLVDDELHGPQKANLLAHMRGCLSCRESLLWLRIEKRVIARFYGSTLGSLEMFWRNRLHGKLTNAAGNEAADSLLSWVRAAVVERELLSRGIQGSKQRTIALAAQDRLCLRVKTFLLWKSQRRRGRRPAAAFERIDFADVASATERVGRHLGKGRASVRKARELCDGATAKDPERRHRGTMRYSARSTNAF